jgi:hypothetical protein
MNEYAVKNRDDILKQIDMGLRFRGEDFKKTITYKDLMDQLEAANRRVAYG